MIRNYVHRSEKEILVHNLDRTKQYYIRTSISQISLRGVCLFVFQVCDGIM